MSEPHTQAVAKTGTAGLKAILAQPAYSKRFEEIMGKRAPQFVASIISVASSLPADTEPQTIVTSAMVAATLDLPINKDLGFAWIVPYRNHGAMQAQFQMGHKGFIQLALRTGQYGGMNARAINADAFGGYDAIGEPIIHWDKIDETKEVVGYAFAWKLTGGFTKVCYWSKKRVEEHARRYSQAYAKGYNSPWKTHFDQMALKTVIKNELSDWGILSVEMRQASKFDQGVVLDVDSEIVQYPDNNQEQEVPRAEAAPGPAPAKAPFRRASAPTTDVKPPASDDGDLGPQVVPVAERMKQEAAAPSNVVNIESEVKQNPPSASPVAQQTQAASSTQASASAQPAGGPQPSQTQSEEPSTSKRKEEFILPPKKTPDDWLPYISPDDPAAVQKSVFEWLSYEEITPEEFLEWAKGRGLAKDGQAIKDLAVSKLISIIKQRELVRKAVLEKRT